MNKTEAGFHLLMIISKVDGKIEKAESNVLLDFLEKNFRQPIDLIKEQAFLMAYPMDDMMDHFIETAEQFFKISTSNERNKILQFAMKICMADNKMENGENKFINALYDAWGLD
ncbi:MAG: TerB family tellurite resistance protein [Bacteroidota bacterium]